MKKVINESIIRNIVRESLMKIIAESVHDYNEEKSFSDKWEDVEDDFFHEHETDPDLDYDEDDIWDKYGNPNRLDYNGFGSLAAQGHPKAFSTKMARNGNKSFTTRADDFDDFDIDFEATNDEANFLMKHAPATFDLNESVRRAVRTSLKRIMSEQAYTAAAVAPENAPKQQVNRSNRMQKTVGRPNVPKELEDYLCSLDNFYGYVGRLARENNTDYLSAIKNLQSKVSYYLSMGYFGKNQDVVNTIKKFTELLSYLYGLYQKEAKKQWAKRGVNEGIFDKVRDTVHNVKDAYYDFVYPDQNDDGINQKVRDDSGNPYAVNQMNGQWMTDLQNELKQFLEWKFLFGPKTIAATEAFIQFLNVKKRSLMGAIFTKASKPLQVMKSTLIGVAVLASVMGGLSGDAGANGGNNGGAMAPTQTAGTEVVTQQSQTINIGFNVNQSKIGQADMQQLGSMKGYEGNVTIIVHESQNSSGKDASYENQLVQQRGNSIMKALGLQNCNIQRGENVIGQPYAEVVFN